LGTLKNAGSLGISGTDFDTQLLRIAEQSSRMIDKETNRFYYIYEGSYYQDGSGRRLILDWDVQSITTLKSDPDGDGTYDTEYNLASTAPYDCFLYPLNGTPKTRLEINPNGDIGHFAAGIPKGIEITGVFGYGADWPASYTRSLTPVVGSDATSTAATLSVTASTASEITAGMTLRIESEQLYVNAAPTASSVPVARAVNGTSAAAHTVSTSISAYDYPQAITQACLIQTIRSWKRRESGYVNTIINTDMGSVQVWKGLDPDVKDAIREYRRERIV